MIDVRNSVTVFAAERIQMALGKKRLINWINVAEDNAQEPQELHDLATY